MKRACIITAAIAILASPAGSKAEDVFDEFFDRKDATIENLEGKKKKDLSAEEYIIQSNSSVDEKIAALKGIAENHEKLKKYDAQIAVLWKIQNIPGISDEKKAAAAAGVGKVCEQLSTDPLTGHIIPKYHNEKIKAYRAAVDSYRNVMKEKLKGDERVKRAHAMIGYCRGIGDAESTKEALGIIEEMLSDRNLEPQEKMQFFYLARMTCKDGANGKYRNLHSSFIQRQAELPRLSPTVKATLLYDLAQSQFNYDRNIAGARKTLASAAALQNVKESIASAITAYQDMLSDED